ncbi:hypothetical protein ABB07_09135 [Streptomyces incarnatus]|uniref:Uncharacterized protein n=2 Tax=Streptomyces incarnatus TaxID=665007 RepID=A0ABN4G9X2_9ACTN|nr:hypothetical protein ABB07_09135 [Streptomyces incarnatus]
MSSQTHSTFATELAAHLPGQWHRRYTGFPPPQDQPHVADQVWDCGPTHSALLDWAPPTAFLDGPAGEQLCVIPRPRYPRQYLVAPLRPDGFKPHHFRGMDEPNGIAVPDDPIRAAAQVARRVLPRYAEALNAVRRSALHQPEPPHRPAAPEVTESLTLIWYPDGVVGAPSASVPAVACTVLYACCFQYSPHEAAFVLPASYSTEARALLLQSAVRQLTAQGIGVNFRHAAPTPSRPISTAAPTLGAPPGARQPAARR